MPKHWSLSTAPRFRAKLGASGDGTVYCKELVSLLASMSSLHVFLQKRANSQENKNGSWFTFEEHWGRSSRGCEDRKSMLTAFATLQVFERESFTEPGACRLAQMGNQSAPCIFLVPASQCWDYRLVPPHLAFHTGAGGLNFILLFVQQGLYPLSCIPRLTAQHSLKIQH